MLKKGYKGRCEKQLLSKCNGVCKTYNPIQTTYANMLQSNCSIQGFDCNVPLEGDEYTTDFVCVRNGGDLLVRECVYRKQLTKPLTVKLLDISREYWKRHGIIDWGIVIDEDK